jgi:hypothetical protein
MTKRGRKKATATRAIVLDYRSWIIEYDGGAWPSDCFILRKNGVRTVGYFSNLESALKKMYDSMLGDYVNRKNNYGAKFDDLANLIIDVKKDFSMILTTPCVRNCLKMNDDENREAPIQ